VTAGAGVTLSRDLERRLSLALDRLDQSTDRFARYKADPVAFFREQLHVEPWTRHPTRTDRRSSQIEIIQAAATETKITVQSGHGVGKTTLVAGLAWHFVKTRGPGCRVFLLSSKGDQTQEAVWREIRAMWLREHKQLGGKMPTRGKTGWTGPEQQQIIILTADKAGKIQGLRAPEMLIIADEAAEIDEGLFVGLFANLSGGGSWFMIGNPTEPEGTFFRANQPGSGWVRFHISSEDSPNVIERREVIKGMVTFDWVEERRRDWDRVTFAKRVLGEYVLDEAGKPITWAMLKASIARWPDAVNEGTLSAGVDPAGYGRDATVICLLRGQKVLGFWRFEKISEDRIVTEVRALLQRHRRDGEVPDVKCDVDGLGAKVGYILGPLAEKLRGERPREGFRFHPVKPSLPAQRDAVTYERTRDELFASLIAWFEAGGAITPDNDRLNDELTKPRWHTKPNGQNKKTDKDAIRKLIGRSPDFADSLELAVWNAAPWAAAHRHETRAPPARAPVQDPYEAASHFEFHDAPNPFEPKD
jgi:phage terminase large subunit